MLQPVTRKPGARSRHGVVDLLTPRHDVGTFADFCAIVPDGQKADLLDGEIYMASPDNTDANDLNGWLYRLLSDFVQERNLGKVYVSRVAYRLDEHNGPEPDIGFVSQRRLRLVKRKHVAGAPDLAIEIVSPDSVLRDYRHKRQKHEEHGVKEYWIIDPDEQRTKFLELHRGRFRDVEPMDGVYSSRVLPGFRLEVRWLWMKRRPTPFRLIQQMLDA